MTAVPTRRASASCRWLLALFCLIVPIAGTAAAAAPELTDAQFDALLGRVQEQLELQRQQAIRDGDHLFPGATAAFVIADGRGARFATGVADIESGRVMPLGARMPAGSVGKTFVAALAVELAAEGTIDLDLPISRWLGDEPWFDRLPNHDRITLRHLLNHSSGLSDHVFAPDSGFEHYVMRWLTRPATGGHFDPVDLVRLVLDREPLFAPGAGFHYTDTGYILVGLVIEAATGAPYYAQLTERLLDPLDLTDTEPLDRRAYNGLVPGYAPEAEHRFGFPHKVANDGVFAFDPSLEWTGGGLLSSSKDLARWIRALFDGRAIGAHSVAEMLESTAAVPGRENEHQPAAYGLGIAIVETPFGTAYRHGGFFPGYNSMVAWYPRYRLAVALQINSDRSMIEDHFHALVRTIVGTLRARPHTRSAK